MEQRRTAIVTIAFGATVAMWGVGYIGRLPSIMASSPVLAGGLLACLFASGWMVGGIRSVRRTDAALAGALAGLLNLLILGSFLSGDQPGRLLPSAGVWVLGSLAASAALVLAGHAVGRLTGERAAPDSWIAWFGGIAVAATMFLIGLGGLVTSAEAGLAVVDWPNSFGYNMFLYPLSRMTGGIYYEHAHRLFGALVGLTTVTFATLIQIHERRRWVKRLGWAAVVMVIAQGIMGGLRVTGEFTMSQEAADMSPSTVLALVHGVFGQLFFATLVSLSVFVRRGWIQPVRRLARASASLDWKLGGFALAALVLQLALGAAQRHLQHAVLIHLGWGMLVVTPLLLIAGARAWSVDELPVLKRIGMILASGVGLQVMLGFIAYAVTGAAGGEAIPALDLVIATAHQWFGAALLGLTAMLVCWNARLLTSTSAHTEIARSTATPVA